MKEQAHADPAQAIFGKTHIIRLVAVRKKQRAELQRRAIENLWSTKRLEAEIRKSFGSRRDGGRRPRIASDKEGLYTQLEKMCEHWRRWIDEFSKKPPDSSRRQIWLHDLPVPHRKQLKQAGKFLRILQEDVSRELQILRPSREARAPFRLKDEAKPTKKS